MQRAQRLRKGSEFDNAYSKGTVIGSPFFVLRYVNNDLLATRWGFAVGKRLAKRAVVRNRMKRRMSEAARGCEVAPGFDLVVVARAPALAATYAELVVALRRSLERAGLMGEAT